MSWVYNDGGRKEAGYKGTTNDCVIRAVAIATSLPYKQVYRDIKKLLGKGQSPRGGVPKKVYKKYLQSLGWEWVATMRFGEGCTTHLNEDELPSGILIVEVSKHVVCVIDGVLQDTSDCSREGKRCVYGYYTKRG